MRTTVIVAAHVLPALLAAFATMRRTDGSQPWPALIIAAIVGVSVGRLTRTAISRRRDCHNGGHARTEHS